MTFTDNEGKSTNNLSVIRIKFTKNVMFGKLLTCSPFLKTENSRAVILKIKKMPTK